MDPQESLRCVLKFELEWTSSYFDLGVHQFLHTICISYFQVEEVYNFSQDDLLTEDILILDTHAEVFVWVGQSVDSKEKQSAFEIGQVLVK